MLAKWQVEKKECGKNHRQPELPVIMKLLNGIFPVYQSFLQDIVVVITIILLVKKLGFGVQQVIVEIMLMTDALCIIKLGLLKQIDAEHTVDIPSDASEINSSVEIININLPKKLI